MLFSEVFIRTISRRGFLKQSAAATAALTVSGPAIQKVFGAAPVMTPGPGNKWPGRVAINFNKTAITGASAPVVSVIQTMVDECIKRLTDQATVGAAWKAVFPPTLSLQSKIAIKVNTANSGPPGTHWSSVKQIADGLAKIDFSGTPFPKTNITIYDMNFMGHLTEAGFTKENFPDVSIVFTSLVDGGDGAMGNKRYASVVKDADFLINVFSPRGHSYPPVGSQFTLVFKSHVGTYASDYQDKGEGTGPALHANLVQNLRDMNCTGPVFKKTVLCVCSGIFGMNEGNGPGGAADYFTNYAKTMDASSKSKVAPTTIMMSTDPISAEMQAIKMLRLNASPAGKYDVANMPPYLQASAGITGALEGTTYNIGVIDESQMDVRRVINGVTSIGAQTISEKPTENPFCITASPLLGNGSTFIEFTLPFGDRGSEAIVEIFTISGALVKRLRQPVLGYRNHCSWNNRNTAGAPVSGPFVVRVTCGKTMLSARFVAGR